MSLPLDESGTSDDDEDRETEYTLPDGTKVQASPLVSAEMMLQDRALPARYCIAGLDSRFNPLTDRHPTLN